MKIGISSSIIIFIGSIISGIIIGFIFNDLRSGLATGIFSLIANSILFLVLKVFKVNNYNWYYFSFVIIFLITCIIMLLILKPVGFYPPPIVNNGSKKIPAGILINFQRWEFQANISRTIYNILTILATATSIIVAMRISNLDVKVENDLTFNKITKMAAFIAAFSFGIISAFNFGEKANNFRAAWRYMHSSILRYEHIPDYTIEKLIDDYYRAEEIVGDVKPTPK